MWIFIFLIYYKRLHNKEIESLAKNTILNMVLLVITWMLMMYVEVLSNSFKQTLPLNQMP